MSANPLRHAHPPSPNAPPPPNPPPSPSAPTTLPERLSMMRKMVEAEGRAIIASSSRLSIEAVRAAELTAQCRGSVIVTGIGKAGLVGQKLVATLASTGTPAHFLHPAEAVHGDLGRVSQHDLVWAFSNSGRSEEVIRIASQLRHQSSGLIALTATTNNPLANTADCVVATGEYDEACPHGLAPSSSTAVLMAIGDCIALMASQLRSFTAQDFARFHPGGALGRKLASIDQIMRPIEACRVSSEQTSIREAMITTSRTGRRTGAIMIVSDEGHLTGIFTDSDLARLLEQRKDETLDDSIAKHMTLEPKSVHDHLLLQDAVSLMSSLRISELPVIDEHGRPVGLLDITDLVALVDTDRGNNDLMPPTLKLHRE